MDHKQYAPMLPFLQAVPDPRQARGQRNPWLFLLVGVSAALLSGQLNGRAIAEWVAEHVQEIATFLRLKVRGAPSHSTLRRALRHVDVKALERVLAEHNQVLDKKDRTSGKVAGADGQFLQGQAIDGKEVRGAGAHGAKVHLLSLVRHGSGTALAKQEVGQKTNEIPTVPKLLAGRDLKGIVITLDALNTQRATAQLLLDQGGDYLMVVKENQPALYAAIETLFRDTPLPREDDRDTYGYPGKAHGRLETRTLTCSAELNGYLDWPGVKQVVQHCCLPCAIMAGQTSRPPCAITTPRRAGRWPFSPAWRLHQALHLSRRLVRVRPEPEVAASQNPVHGEVGRLRYEQRLRRPCLAPMPWGPAHTATNRPRRRWRRRQKRSQWQLGIGPADCMPGFGPCKLNRSGSVSRTTGPDAGFEKALK